MGVIPIKPIKSPACELGCTGCAEQCLHGALPAWMLIIILLDPDQWKGLGGTAPVSTTIPFVMLEAPS